MNNAANKIWTAITHTGQYDHAMRPVDQYIPVPGDELRTVAYPDLGEWNGFLRRLREGKCTIGEYLGTEPDGTDRFAIVSNTDRSPT